MIFDSAKAGLPIRRAAGPKIDFGNLMPHFGSTQVVSHSVCTRSYNRTYQNRPGIPPVTAEEKATCGIYYAKIHYQREFPSPWRFA